MLHPHLQKRLWKKRDHPYHPEEEIGLPAEGLCHQNGGTRRRTVKVRLDAF